MLPSRSLRAFWTLTRPRPLVWQATLNNPPDNRLSPAVLTELAEKLDDVEAEWRRSNDGASKPEDKKGGSLVLASASDKFFSNGLVPETLTSPDFMHHVFDPTKLRLLTYPLVTVAAVSGHTFAGAFLLALCCDYRIMTAKKGLWSMNEVLIGVPITGANAGLLRAKLPPVAVRDAALGKRFTQSYLLQHGIVDELVDGAGEAVVDRAVALAEEEAPRVALGSYGAIKEGLYTDLFNQAAARRVGYYPEQEARAFWDRMERKGKVE